MTIHTSIDSAAMLALNLSLILNTLRLHGPASRANLATLTGLNKTTISSRIKALIAAGFVHELEATATTTGEIGRPSINLELDPDAGYLISVEIGDYFVSVIATNFSFEVLTRHYEDTAKLPNQQAVLERVLELLSTVYKQVNHRGKPIFGIAVAVPGLVEVARGEIIVAPNLGWENVPLRAIIQQQFGDTLVYVANEANMAAWGESYFSKRAADDFLLYISSGMGIGGGIVQNGQLLTGANGFAGEVGHMAVVPGGLPCNCGSTGCWETMCNQIALYRRITEAVESGRLSLISTMLDGDLTQLTIAAIVQAARKGDLVAHEALEETAYWLGVGIANLMNIINPRHVVLGGPLSVAHEFLKPTIERTIMQRVLPKNYFAETAIGIAIHGPDATVMGGIATIHSEVLKNPTRWME